MAAPGGDGPRLNQRIRVFQGSAGVVYVIPIDDEYGNRPDLSQATATWWVGPLPVVRPGQTASYVAGSPGAYSKDLQIVSDGAGGWQVVLPIDPADIAPFAPGGFWQHEVWISDQTGTNEPVTIGPLIVIGTVKGTSA